MQRYSSEKSGINRHFSLSCRLAERYKNKYFLQWQTINVDEIFKANNKHLLLWCFKCEFYTFVTSLILCPLKRSHTSHIKGRLFVANQPSRHSKVLTVVLSVSVVISLSHNCILFCWIHVLMLLKWFLLVRYLTCSSTIVHGYKFLIFINNNNNKQASRHFIT